MPQPHKSHLKPRNYTAFDELKNLVHDGKIFSTDQCTNLYFSCVEVICNLAESFQVYSNLIRNQPELAGEYTSKQAEQASYYMKEY